VRDAEGAGEVPARAAGDHGDLDALALRNPVDDLVHGTVAADDDQLLCAFVRRPPRELGELSRCA
jgi:hypothetical protein